VGPRYAFVENSSALTIRGLGRVLGDLAEMGMSAEWCVLGADDVGAPHIRKRIWILAYATEQYGAVNRQTTPEPGWSGEAVPDTSGARLPKPECQTLFRTGRREEGGTTPQCDRGATQSGLGRVAAKLAVGLVGPWTNEPGGVPRVAKGVKNRVGRLKALGNGQVPLTAALAFLILHERIQN
jgi:DNA (cytosine-5)-methyltransferase 1